MSTKQKCMMIFNTKVQKVEFSMDNAILEHASKVVEPPNQKVTLREIEKILQNDSSCFVPEIIGNGRT